MDEEPKDPYVILNNGDNSQKVWGMVKVATPKPEAAFVEHFKVLVEVMAIRLEQLELVPEY